ncbi:hypothetical protein GCM10023172_10180 [Hymenobacter ginsengisoli]|uniref:Acid-shock protein n=1 Tax=Hymenobacter ginsengisoli TaxID=1051626 RepID=A0ABP8Q2M6_9BACT|nr:MULTISPECIES: hypothetical protein [unclassified Hymenobacter]MBO2032407.1 hypothetical protein [Hymenobacter sp. BT559]
MKAFLLPAGALALSALLVTAQAQGLPKVTANPVNTKDKAATARATANRRATTYKGPKVVKNTEALGKKMLRDSKPAHGQVAPAVLIPAN